MRVLIVGCGYVGLPLGAELVRRGHQVWGLRRTAEASAELRGAGIEPLVGDITQAASLAGLPLGYEWVVNCVASSGGGPETYRQVYLEGTRNLLTWLAPQPPQKLVYTSSTSVYGQNDGSWVEETSVTEPAAETGHVLLETEALLLQRARSGQFPAVVLRLAGIYGPERGYWFKQFIQGEARLEGQGQRFLNMIHRDDVVGAAIAALQHGRAGEVYNVVDDEPVSQLIFFEWLARELGQPLPPSVPEDSVAVRRRGTTNKRVSNRKLKAELQYQFKYPSFREGYAEEVERWKQARR